MSTTARHTRKGRKNPRHGLLQQAKVSIGLALKYAGLLDKAGWSADKTTALQAAVTNLETDISAQTEERGEARVSTVSEHETIDEAKKFLRRLRSALPMVLRDAPLAEISASSFQSGALARSTPKISAYLGRIRASVALLDPKLRPYFDGQDASASLDKIKAKLDAADTKQEVMTSGLPRKTRQIYTDKGQVTEMIEDLNRVAKIAFDGQEAELAEFNKDLILRARQPRKKNKPGTKPDTKPAAARPKAARTSRKRHG